jgi:hypothetical protein
MPAIGPTPGRAAGLARRLYLVRGSQVGFRQLDLLFGPGDLALVPLLESFIHCVLPHSRSIVVSLRRDSLSGRGDLISALGMGESLLGVLPNSTIRTGYARFGRDEAAED